MRKWVLVLASCSVVAACAGGNGEFVTLRNTANERVTCGPFGADRPIARYLEKNLGSPEDVDDYGRSAEAKMRACVDRYRAQGFEVQVAAAPVVPVPAPVERPDERTLAAGSGDYAATVRDIRQLARPNAAFDAAAAAADRGDYAAVLGAMRPLVQQGDAAAQIVLGKAYAGGLGVPQNYVEAHKWYNLAAAHSATAASERQLRDMAAKERSAVSTLMSPDQIAEAQRLAREAPAR